MCSRAYNIAMKVAVETTCWLATNRGGKMIGQIAACWDKRMVVMRVGSSVDEIAEKTVVERAGYITVNWVDKMAGWWTEKMDVMRVGSGSG